MSEKSLRKLLTAEEVDTILGRCIEFLSSKGWIKIDNHPEGLKMLDKLGAQVDFANQQIRLPRDIIEQALRTVPHSFTLGGGSERHDLLLPHPDGLFHVRGVTGAHLYFDPDTNSFRDLTIADNARWSQLSELLEEINIVPFSSAADVPVETKDIHALKGNLENTSKHIVIQPYGRKGVEYHIRLAQAASGGAEALKSSHRISMLAAPLVPFVIKEAEMEVIIQCGQAGVPISSNTLPNRGGTGPMTVAGTILSACIDLMAVVVVSQMLSPGTPVIGQPNYFSIDMHSGRCLCASVETHLGAAASAQFVKEALGIPSWTWGMGSDSYVPDGEAILEKTLGGLLTSGIGCDIISGAGGLDAALGISPIQLIIDNEIVKILKRAKQGVKVDDDTLAWEEILATAPGGQFLDSEHTLKHCRDDLRNELLLTPPKGAWSAQGKKDLYSRAVDKYKELEKKMKPLDLPAEVKREMDNIVKHADEHLVK